MTKLEQEMLKEATNAVWESNKSGQEWKQVIAYRCAEVAKKYIKKAFIDGYYALADIENDEWPHPEKITGQVLGEQWLKENGIVE